MRRIDRAFAATPFQSMPVRPPTGRRNGVFRGFSMPPLLPPAQVLPPRAQTSIPWTAGKVCPNAALIMPPSAGTPPEWLLTSMPGPVFGDAIERQVTWKNGGDVSALAGRPVRLRFVLKDADLYALRFGF